MNRVHSPPRSFAMPRLRKICFGGLYLKPEWAQGRQSASDVRLELDSLVVE